MLTIVSDRTPPDRVDIHDQAEFDTLLVAFDRRIGTARSSVVVDAGLGAILIVDAVSGVDFLSIPNTAWLFWVLAVISPAFIVRDGHKYRRIVETRREAESFRWAVA